MSAPPPHLAGTAAAGLVRGAVASQYELGGAMKNLVYVLACWATGGAAVVDPQRDLDGLLADLEAHGLALERVLLTHTHHDHVAGLPLLARRFPAVPVHVHPLDAGRLEGQPAGPLAPVAEGDLLRVGALEVEVLHTPGHSAGEVCYLVRGAPPHLCTGDTLFVRDCGRTDLPTGSDAAMFATLRRLAALPPETVILPGHHYRPEVASTLARELETSPPLRCRTVDELRALP